MPSNRTSRRSFLRAVAVGAGSLAATLWLPRRSRGNPPDGSIRRVVIVHAPGGVRWTASFDGQSTVRYNPWGMLPWSLVGRGQPPAWGFSRMLLQKPLWRDATNWSGNIFPYLTSDDPAHYHVAPTALSTWNGAALPSLADMTSSIATVRLTADPGGPSDLDHTTASRTLYTGYRTGQVGLVTAFNDALRRQLGADYDVRHPLPAVSVTQPSWSIGADEFASARPIFLTDAMGLPDSDPGLSAARWARQAEAALDAQLAASLPGVNAQMVADFINDKSSADLHVRQLVHPALKLSAPSEGDSPALGTLVDGETPLTNDMLAEAFGISSTRSAAGDFWFDIFGATQATAQPSWSAAENPFALNGALAVRLLQLGAPIVSITVGAYDTHSYEVIDPYKGHAMTTQVAALGRLFAGLGFVLQRTADPMLPGASLWDSTVVVACSEFGRIGAENGFNSPDGSNDGGSDHDPWSAWPLFGGPVTAGGQLLTDGGSFYQQNRIFTTLLKGLGIDDVNSPYLPVSQFSPIPGLVRGV